MAIDWDDPKESSKPDFVQAHRDDAMEKVRQAAEARQHQQSVERHPEQHGEFQDNAQDMEHQSPAQDQGEGQEWPTLDLEHTPPVQVTDRSTEQPMDRDDAKQRVADMVEAKTRQEEFNDLGGRPERQSPYIRDNGNEQGDEGFSR